MRPNRLLRPLLAIAASLSIATSTIDAQADEAPHGRCVPPGSVSVRVAPFADAAISRRIESEIASELGSTPSRPCWHLPGESRGPDIEVDVRWYDRSRARVTIVAITPQRVHYGVRDLDLEKLPDDGIPLAVAIATDELLETIGEQLAHAPVLQPPPRDAPPAPPPAPSPPPPPPHRRLGFGPAAAIDVLGSGVALVGPDARLLVPLTSSVALSLRVGSRVAADLRSREPARPTGAWIAGGALRVGSHGGPSGFSVSAGIDATTLRITGPTDTIVKTLAIARAGLSGYVTLAPGLRLMADAYVGGALSEGHAQVGPEQSRSFGQGISSGGAVGIAALF